MQCAAILRGRTHARVRQAIQAMEEYALVSCWRCKNVDQNKKKVNVNPSSCTNGIEQYKIIVKLKENIQLNNQANVKQQEEND